jgi:hypothetical protein
VLARIQIRIREYGLTGLVFIEETLPDRGAASKPHAIEPGFRPLVGFADIAGDSTTWADLCRVWRWMRYAGMLRAAAEVA